MLSLFGMYRGTDYRPIQQYCLPYEVLNKYCKTIIIFKHSQAEFGVVRALHATTEMNVKQNHCLGGGRIIKISTLKIQDGGITLKN